MQLCNACIMPRYYLCDKVRLPGDSHRSALLDALRSNDHWSSLRHLSLAERFTFVGATRCPKDRWSPVIAEMSITRRDTCNHWVIGLPRYPRRDMCHSGMPD